MGNRFTVDADWYSRVDDSASTMTATLKDGSGSVVNLTDTTSITFEAYGPGPDVTQAASSAAPATGVVTVTPTFTDTGTYYGRFVVIFTSGNQLSFPTDDDIVILVRGPE